MRCGLHFCPSRRGALETLGLGILRDSSAELIGRRGRAYIPSLDDSSLTGATKYCCTKYNSGWMMNLEREEKYVDVKV